jgi:RNA polymerase sigma factor (sigma-70 family)
MNELEDSALLREYVGRNSEAAFAELVTRHLNQVYSTALRHTRNPHQAEEITQAVFVILARKANKLTRHTALSGWLYQTARLTAVTLIRGETRRVRREQEALMQTSLNENESDPWPQIAPLLDDALAKLGETDRHAVVLRYFDGKSLGEVGAALGGSEDAAKMRVNRALEKLRIFFSKRGVTLSAAMIAGTLATNSVQAAPAGLAATVTATAVKGTVISATLATLIKTTMKTMTWLKLKFAAGVSVAALLAGGAATMAISQTSKEDRPTAQEIIKKSQNAYAALTSYSDDGKEAGSVGTAKVAPHTFSIKLARPDLYKIEWTQDMGFYAQKGSVWSAGNGDYLEMESATKPEKYPNPDAALSAAMGISGGASGSIPKSFFDLHSGRLEVALRSASRKPDEKIGGVDCYVLTETTGGRTQTLWIGKPDFLIRQIETDTSAAVLKATLDEEAKKHPEIQAMLLRGNVGGDVKSVETHANIVVNQAMSQTDFTP